MYPKTGQYQIFYFGAMEISFISCKLGFEILNVVFWSPSFNVFWYSELKGYRFEFRNSNWSIPSYFVGILSAYFLAAKKEPISMTLRF